MRASLLYSASIYNIYEAVWAESDSKLTALKNALQVFKQCPRLKILSDKELEKVAFIVSKADNPKKIIRTIVMELDSKETVQALRDEAFLQKMVNDSLEEQMSEELPLQSTRSDEAITGLFGRKKIYISKGSFQSIIGVLATSLEAVREEYIFVSLSQLKREGVDVSNVPTNISPGSELEDALDLLTSMIGIAWDYIKNDDDQLLFDDLLSEHMKAKEGSRAWTYRERYTDCQGDMDSLAKTLSLDVHKNIGFPIPIETFIDQFRGGAYVLIVLSQATTYSACGDNKMERKVKKNLHGIKKRSHFPG